MEFYGKMNTEINIDEISLLRKRMKSIKKYLAEPERIEKGEEKWKEMAM